MKVNDIRKFAKEIRTGKCRLNFEEISRIADEIAVYMESEAADGWTERTKEFLRADALDIARYIESVRPSDEGERIEDTEEIVRRNFKTVVAEMAGKQHPILEAVRWFATVYARDGYEKAKCIRGMIERRGYATKDDEFGFWVMRVEDQKAAAYVGDDNGKVAMFDIYD